MVTTPARPFLARFQRGVPNPVNRPVTAIGAPSAPNAPQGSRHPDTINTKVDRETTDEK